MKVKLLSEELVKPKAPAPQHQKTLELSVLDQVQLRLHAPPILGFMPPLPAGLTFEDFLQNTKTALSTALVSFYPLAGRLVRRDEGCLAVDCNDAGILVRAAEANCEMPQEIALGTELAGSEKLFFAKREDDITTVPLLLVQFTRFQDNSVSVYFGFHHTIVGGAGGSLFRHYWSELMLGKAGPFQAVHDRSLIKASGKPLESTTNATIGPSPPLPAVVKLVLANPKMLSYVPRWLLPDVAYHRIAFSKAKLEILEADANKGLPAGQTVSINEALCALMWRSVSAARGLNKVPDQTTRVALSVDIRTRMQPHLPEEYFGNTDIATLSESAGAQVVISQPLSWSASLVRDAVARAGNTYITSMIDWIAAQPDKAVLGTKINAHLGPDLFITSLPASPVKMMDLGWGTALSIGHAKPQMPVDGIVMLVHDSRGGVCAYVGLLAKHMKQLMKHEPLLKYIEEN